MKFNSFEHLEAAVTTPRKNIRLVVLYRPPNNNTTSFLEDFTALVARLAQVHDPVIIAGDFNIHVNVLDRLITNNFLQLLDEHGMVQHVCTPTHRKGHILDLFITKDCSNIVSDVSVCDHMIADHFSVVASMVVGQPPRKTRRLVSSRNLKDLSLGEFSSGLTDLIDKQSYLREHGDANRKAELYSEAVSGGSQQTCPSRHKAPCPSTKCQVDDC